MTFYFYDLETSGINARAQRVMQFAGQRTDENFKPIGQPQNWLIKLTDEILPDPEAVLVTDITPQKTLEEGYTEAEFLKLFYGEVLQPDTVIMGFNTIRFDDEFMRATLWRNFYDPYEWQWQDGRSRWDLLDVVRMVRALRPDGIQWPFDMRPKEASEHGEVIDTQGQEIIKVPSNRLELLTKLNNLSHENAHDALSDVMATIAVAKLLKEKQPKMFEYLLSMRDKKQVAALLDLDNAQPVIYTSGRYSSKWEKTTAVLPIGTAVHGSILVFDLRQDPTVLSKLNDEVLTEQLFTRNKETEILPVKVLKPNACPAVAPLGVLDQAAEKRLGLSLEGIQKHLTAFRSIEGFGERIANLFEAYTTKRRQQYAQETDPDFQIYDGFVGEGDKTKMRAVRGADENTLSDMNLDFNDERLELLLPRFKARNFPKSITSSERELWETYRSERLLQGRNGQLSLQQFIDRLTELAQLKQDESSQFLLEELKLYAENIMPIED